MIIYKHIKKDDLLVIANLADVSRTTIRILTEKVRNLIINDVESSNYKLGGFDSNGQKK
jgi:hypothetical protein